MRKSASIKARTLTGIPAASRRYLLAPAALTLLIAAGGCNSSATATMDVVERFDGNKYDRSRCQLAMPGAGVGSVRVENNQLVITAPPSQRPRPQIRNVVKTAFDGDFEVSMDFKLLTPIPEPEKEYVNLELIVHGADGVAHLSRANHKGSGNGIVAYFAPSTKSRKSVWKHFPAEDEAGSLRVSRKGSEVDFAFKPQDSTNYVSVGSAHFGRGPVKGMSVALSVASPTSKQLQVAVDNIEVHARPRPAVSIIPIVTGLTVLLVCGLAALVLWGWKTRRSRSVQPNSG